LIWNGHVCIAYDERVLLPLIEWYIAESPSVMAYRLRVMPTTCSLRVPNTSLASCHTDCKDTSLHSSTFCPLTTLYTTAKLMSSKLSTNAPAARSVPVKIENV
jgi:hypothetical protein